jgi:hypothetical protein
MARNELRDTLVPGLRRQCAITYGKFCNEFTLMYVLISSTNTLGDEINGLETLQADNIPHTAARNYKIEMKLVAE